MSLQKLEAEKYKCRQIVTNATERCDQLTSSLVEIQTETTLYSLTFANNCQNTLIPNSLLVHSKWQLTRNALVMKENVCLKNSSLP